MPQVSLAHKGMPHNLCQGRGRFAALAGFSGTHGTQNSAVGPSTIRWPCTYTSLVLRSSPLHSHRLNACVGVSSGLRSIGDPLASGSITMASNAAPAVRVPVCRGEHHTCVSVDIRAVARAKAKEERCGWHGVRGDGHRESPLPSTRMSRVTCLPMPPTHPCHHPPTAHATYPPNPRHPIHPSPHPPPHPPPYVAQEGGTHEAVDAEGGRPADSG